MQIYHFEMEITYTALCNMNIMNQKVKKIFFQQISIFKILYLKQRKKNVMARNRLL